MVVLQLEEQPPLIQAIFAGVIDEVKELIEYKQDVNCLDCEKRTPLHAAAFKGEAAISSLLLQNGARVNAKDGKWITPLHRACSVDATETVSLLLNYQADVSARNRLWQTPLHVAAANDAYNSVDQLLNHIPNPNVTDRSGRTALHHSAYNGHTDVCELLISKGCMVNACDKKDFRPLHCAVQMGHVDTVELLIKFGADFNAKDRNQYTPLHVAAASGMETVSKMLIHARADVNNQNSFGNTPLHIACLNSNLNICKDLVDSGANVEPVNFRGQTPLHIAAASIGGVDCTVFLLQQGVDINKQSLDGRTPLHMTAIHGRFTRSKMLIDKGAVIDCADKNGSTPLHIAAQYGHDLLANTLLGYGANPSKKGYEGRTPLHMCCLSGYVECARKFVQSGVDLNDKDDTGKTPTHCAAYKGSYECLDLLVSNGANFKVVDNNQRLPLHYAASQGHYQCIFTLVGIGSPVNSVDLDGCTPLHLAAAFDHEGKCIEYILNHRADAKISDNRGFSPLHYAVSGGNNNAVAILLNKELKMKEITRQENSEIKILINNLSIDVTPLHLAAKLGNIEILRRIIPHYEDVNVRTNQGLTPLVLAAREGHAQCVHFLLRFAANLAISDNINGMTPVHYSAKNGHSQCLSLLLHHSEDQSVVNKRDREQRTALMLSVSGNHLECVQTLLKYGADPNIVDTEQHSCLFRAVVNGQNSIVQLLLSNNTQVRTTDVNGKTVLHLAAACGHLICMQMIMSYMSEEEIQAKDKQDCTALHWACYNGYSDCVEVLLKRNVFKELKGNSFSPIHCATFSGSQKCLQLLINQYGDSVVHLTDSRQRTPLHIAALHGHVECAKYLIKHDAEVEVIDEEGRTPYIAAAQYGQTPIVVCVVVNMKVQVNSTASTKAARTLVALKRYQENFDSEVLNSSMVSTLVKTSGYNEEVESDDDFVLHSYMKPKKWVKKSSDHHEGEKIPKLANKSSGTEDPGTKLLEEDLDLSTTVDDSNTSQVAKQLVETISKKTVNNSTVEASTATTEDVLESSMVVESSKRKSSSSSSKIPSKRSKSRSKTHRDTTILIMTQSRAGPSNVSSQPPHFLDCINSTPYDPTEHHKTSGETFQILHEVNRLLEPRFQKDAEQRLYRKSHRISDYQEGFGQLVSRFTEGSRLELRLLDEKVVLLKQQIDRLNEEFVKTNNARRDLVHSHEMFRRDLADMPKSGLSDNEDVCGSYSGICGSNVEFDAEGVQKSAVGQASGARPADMAGPSTSTKKDIKLVKSAVDGEDVGQTCGARADDMADLPTSKEKDPLSTKDVIVLD